MAARGITKRFPNLIDGIVPARSPAYVDCLLRPRYPANSSADEKTPSWLPSRDIGFGIIRHHRSMTYICHVNIMAFLIDVMTCLCHTVSYNDDTRGG